MNRKLAAKLLVDLGLTASMLAALAYHLTGPTAHEWIGLTMFALLAAHNILNWRWYRNLSRTGAGLRGRLGLSVTLILAAVTVALLVSSLIVFREIFGFIQMDNGFLIRQIHTLAAYWIIVLMSVHVGLHWNMLMALCANYFTPGLAAALERPAPDWRPRRSWLAACGLPSTVSWAPSC